MIDSKEVNKTKKIISVVGARPQFIKLAPLHKEFLKHFEIEHLICHTGQHYNNEMSDVFFRELGLPKSDFNLEIGSGNHGEQTGKMLSKIEHVLLNEKPDMVIIFGDTNSTLAGSLVAAKLGIRTIHIEAGLRSYNRKMPEEINRIISDHIGNYLFAPTQTAVDNLLSEGLSDNVYLSGDIMADVLFDNLKRTENVVNKYIEDYYILTLHRPCNVDDAENLIKILKLVDSSGVKTIFPVHPRTKVVLSNTNINFKNIILTAPQGYLEFLALQNHCKKIITDSGGIQKEAYLLKKPCITLRGETEWVETISTGWNLLISKYDDMLPKQINDFEPEGEHPDIFGKDVAKRMVDLAIRFMEL